jgi:repressor LexA
MGRKPLLQKEGVLTSINRLLVKHGMPPTVEELRKELNVGSARTVLRYLQELQNDGTIKRWKGARSIQLLKVPHVGQETVAVPVVGEAPAGPLMMAEQNIEGWVRLPKESLRPTSTRFFMLRVRGDSMNKAEVAGVRIESGDLVLIRQQTTAQPRDIVVALIDGEVTIKRFIPGPGYFILMPESANPKHHPIVLHDEFSIQGVIVRVLKDGAALLNLEEPQAEDY